MNLLNKMGFWDNIGTLFDVIPKIIYYLYACLASGVDALQALVRKLAGLDSYWSATAAGGSNSLVTGRDPLSEFVYGILGVGPSASVYKALNTVFWSLAIFGLIMLVVSTMIAIIKSHYKEDTAATSPWKYIYTAIKAILTFVAIPVVVVIGMQLSTFALNTLDRIIAGSAGEGAITGIYGGDVATRLEYDDETNTYAHYDFFGARDFTTSTPFSGMLFKAAGYNANRMRTGSYSVNDLKSLTNSIFGQTSDQSTEYAAYQVDYAFSNCLMFKKENRPKYQQWVKELSNFVNVKLLDVFQLDNIEGFSKWDVSVVWLFYDLWHFNFIVGFAGVTTCFGVMVSIVFGLLTRLIKGAALFLIFPALLGIAPMDNFKAFQSWGTQFMQLVLMVFGAILGMNLLLLVLPYIQNISFFNPNVLPLNVLNAIMDVVILIVGLQMAKDFINIVNGFVGGADAVAAGEGAKDGAWKAMVSGAKTAVGAGKVGVGVIAAGTKGAVGIGKGIKHAVDRRKNPGIGGQIATENTEVRRRKTDLDTAQRNLTNAQERQRSAQQDINDFENAQRVLDDLDAGGAREARQIQAYRRAHSSETVGMSDADVSAKARAEATNIQASIDKPLADAKLIASTTDISAAQAQIDTLSGEGAGSIQEAQKARSETIKRAERMGYEVKGDRSGVVKKSIWGKFAEETGAYDEDGNMLDKDGKVTTDTSKQAKKRQEGTGIRGGVQRAGEDIAGFGKNFGKKFMESVSWSSIGKNIADGFAKSANAGFQSAGIDKLTKDLIDVAKTTKQTTFKKSEAYEGKEGDKLTKQVAQEQKQRDEKMQELLEKIAENTTPKSDGSSR